METTKEDVNKEENKNSGNKGCFIIAAFWGVIFLILLIVKLLFF